MPFQKLEELRVYQLAEDISDRIWEICLSWDFFAKDTVGKQLVRAADSIGANIAEGYGRGGYAENRQFVRIARGSLSEVRHFLRRADQRKLITPAQKKAIQPLMAELSPKLTAYLKSIGPKPTSEALPK
jgi:four helix bundle protein